VKPILKVAIVSGGYLFAFVVAYAAVALHAALTGESGAQASGGMSAFGDLVLFVAVFGAVALVPTVAAFCFFLSKKQMPKQTLRPMPNPPPEPTPAPGMPRAGQESRHG
jgi:hypothetical protein